MSFKGRIGRSGWLRRLGGIISQLFDWSATGTKHLNFFATDHDPPFGEPVSDRQLHLLHGELRVLRQLAHTFEHSVQTLSGSAPHRLELQVERCGYVEREFL